MEDMNSLSSVSKEVIPTSLEDAVTFLVENTDIEFEIAEPITEDRQARSSCVNNMSVISFSEDDPCDIQQDAGVDFPLTFQLSTNKYLEDHQLDIVDCNINTNELIVTSTKEQEKQLQPPVNILTPVQIPDGPTLYILESETAGAPSQILAMSTKLLPSRDSTTEVQHSKTATRLRSGKNSSTSKHKHGPKSACSSKKSNFESQVHGTHMFNPSSVVTIENDSVVKQFFCCDFCTSSEQSVHFQSYKELLKHYLVAHRLRLLKQASSACREDNCFYKTSRVDDLRQHLKTVHNHTMEMRKVEFKSMTDFEKWKEEEEIRSGSKFIRSSGEHTVPPRDKSLAYSYLTCHRSGIHRTKLIEATKKKKTIPSLKINGVCTASMIVTHDRQVGSVTCEYHSTHYGHDFSNPARQHLSKQEKEWILELVLRGWNSDEIVKTLRSGTIPGTSDRMRRVVRQDVFNICRSKGVRSFERRNEDDAVSVQKWVEKLQSEGSVLVWTYNPEPFLLIVMSDRQVELAKQHGNVLHVADLPLALGGHYRMITLSSPAESEAYLVAYAITEESSIDILKVMIASLQTKLETFQPEFILCQNPEALFNAWGGTNESSPLFLYPPWKIEKELNDGLLKYVDDVGKRDALKKCIDTLLNEKDPSKFTSFLHLFTNMLAMDESLLHFSRCFASAYSEQALHWPRFHPLPDCNSLYNLNGEIELIARRARAIKRLDKCIYSLEYVSVNQPFHSITEFRTTSNAEDNEIASLRHSARRKLGLLEKSLQGCSDVTVLRTINQILDQAVL